MCGAVLIWCLLLLLLQEAWTHLERERCCSMAFMQGSSMNPAAAKALGLSVRDTAAAAAAAAAAQPAAAGLEGSAEPQAASPAASAAAAEAGEKCQCVTEDHLFIGTAKGEVLVCDVSRQGLLVLRVPVLK
jgi:hypothetical protein